MDALDDDLLAVILRNNVGLWTFVQCRAVSKRLRQLCQADESLLLSAALYTGGLTRTRFMGLFALTHAECNSFPCTRVTHAWACSSYHLYRRDAIEQAMRDNRAQRGGGGKAIKVALDRYIFASIDNFAITALPSE